MFSRWHRGPEAQVRLQHFLLKSLLPVSLYSKNDQMKLPAGLPSIRSLVPTSNFVSTTSSCAHTSDTTFSRCLKLLSKHLCSPFALPETVTIFYPSYFMFSITFWNVFLYQEVYTYSVSPVVAFGSRCYYTVFQYSVSSIIWKYRVPQSATHCPAEKMECLPEPSTQNAE